MKGAAEYRPSRWEVAGYEVSLVLGEDARGLPLPKLTFRREDTGRELKGAPRAVKEDALYEEIRRERELSKRGFAEARRAIENSLADGEPVEAEEFARFVHGREARALLSRVLLADAAGRIGLPVLRPGGLSGDPPGEVLALEDLNGREAPAGFPVRVAHPHDLFASGPEVLSGWQRAFVARRVRQPVKQAFRELYVVTPAEVEAGVVSLRFANHAVHFQMARSLLASRGWDPSGDGRSFRREHPSGAGGVQAVFEFETRGHFFGGSARTGGIWFCETAHAAKGPVYRMEGGGGVRGEPLRLEDVAQPFFSEAMRDADLVASVAQLEEGAEEGAFDEGGLAWLSNEGYARRAELLSAFVGTLGLRNVSVDGHFARVKGTRASYRVHLGSAAIHVEPGNYLCIVPARRGGNDERVYLPFAGETEGDRKAKEVVSKVLLLANDAKITDRTILAQLPRTP